MVFRLVGAAIGLGSAISATVAAPSAFPSSGNGIWFTSPGRGFEFWADDWLPVGNGYLAGQSSDMFSTDLASDLVPTAMVNGRTAQEVTQLNIESLWSGGPFQDPVSSYASERRHVVTSRLSTACTTRS